MQSIQTCRLGQVVAPHRLTGISRWRCIGRDQAAHLRVHTIGTDEQVAVHRLAIRQLHLYAVIVLRHIGDRDTEPDARTSGQGGIGQHLLQSAAADAQIGGPVRQQSRRWHSRGADAVGQIDLYGIKACTGVDVAIEQAQLLHGP